MSSGNRSDRLIILWDKMINAIEQTRQRIISKRRLASASRELKKTGNKLHSSLLVSAKEFNLLAKSFYNIREEMTDDLLYSPIVAVDFDGTLCEDQWPEIGPLNIEMIRWLIWRRGNGARIILWTCREGIQLENAILACNSEGLYFDSVNESLPDSIVNFGGNATRKVYATEYIDDRNSKSYWKLPYHPINKK